MLIAILVSIGFGTLLGLMILFGVAMIMKDVSTMLTYVQISSAAAIRGDKTISELYAHTKALYASMGMEPLSPDTLQGNFSNPFTADIYRTDDGKFSATSLPDLLDKIRNNPDYFPTNPQSEYDNLKDAFDDINTNEDEDWKKGKK